MAAAMRPSAASPPMTPPAMAPLDVLCLLVEVGGGTGAVEDGEDVSVGVVDDGVGVRVSESTVDDVGVKPGSVVVPGSVGVEPGSVGVMV